MIENRALGQNVTSMQTTVAIIGGGLAGLYAGMLLHRAGIDFRLIEARERLGGRILSSDEKGRPSDNGFDLGPSWFWPHVQPQLALLVQELGLATFPQYNEGDVIFERMSRETPVRCRAVHQEPQSLRFVGGTAAVVGALAKRLPCESVLVDTCVTQMTLEGPHVTLTTTAKGSEARLLAAQVVAAIPLRLLASITFSPAVDATTVRRWRATATWMAPHAKFFAVYDHPFWRDAGLSGTAQSLVGPLAEIHDATTASGRPALLGFLGIGADMRASLGEVALVQSCLKQLARLYGQEALSARATILKDWAADPFTAAPEDRTASGHTEPSTAAWVEGVWRSRLSLAASETSATDPGFLAGAVSAAERAVREVLQRFEADRRFTHGQA